MRPTPTRAPWWRPLEELRAASALLTRVPVPGPSPTGGGASTFGLVGALVGATGSVPILLVGDTAPLAAAGLALAAMALVTGALHLDGLADTADALASIGPGAAERARSDPRIGAAGAVAVALIVVLDAGWLAALLERSGVMAAALACVSAAAASRATVVVLVTMAPSGRRGASGGWFSSAAGPSSALIAGASATLVVILMAVATDDVALASGAVAGSVAGLGAGLWLVHARAGIDGDLLGATVEIASMSVLGATVLLAA